MQNSRHLIILQQNTENMGNLYRARIEAIREMMREHGWDAVVLSGSDPHSSEYPAERWKQVEWISGFTGEAGDIVITLDHAGLWTDTRYFIQASRQLFGTGIELHKLRIPEAVPIPEWLAAEDFPSAGETVTIAVDGLCQSVSAIDNISSAFESEGKDVTIISVPDLISGLWKDRPEIPVSPVITLGDEEVGESREKKLIWIRKFLMAKGCDAILLSSLDEILDFAYSNKEKDVSAAITAYRAAIDRYPDDSYAPFLIIELAGLYKERASYNEAINLYAESLGMPIIAGDDAMVQEFSKTLRYLGTVQDILNKHHALATPFSKLTPEILQEIEAEFARRQAK